MHVHAPLRMPAHKTMLGPYQAMTRRLGGPHSVAGRLGRNPRQGIGMERQSSPSYPVRTFPESDYRFGAGPLTMTVEYVDWSNPVVYDAVRWYEVYGVEQTPDGRVIGRRRALVKASQLASLPRVGRP
jgi:hypothetical protein